MFVDPDKFSFPIIERYHKEEPELQAVFFPKSGIDGERYVDYRLYAAIPFPSVAPRSAEFEFKSFEETKDFSIRLDG